MFFPKSIGLSLYKDDLIISKASQNLLRCTIESLEVKDFLIKESLDLKLIIDAQGYNGKEVVLSWPREKTIVREIELPASSINELKESISYQLDSFILFAEEDVYYDIYPSFSSEYGEKAFIFAIKKEDIDSILAKLESLNLSPNQIVISPLSLIPFVDENKIAILDKYEDGYSYDLYAESTLVNTSLIKNEDILKERITEDKPDRLILLDKDSNDNIITAIVDFYDFCKENSKVELWSKDKESMGAAINGVTECLKDFNLLRPKSKKLMPQLILMGSLSLIIIVLSFMIPGVIKHKKIRTINTMDATLQKLLPDVKVASKLRDEVESIIETTNKVEEFANPKHRRIDLLEELTKALPDDTWIKHLSFSRDSFEIEGVGISSANVLTLVENTPVFNQAKMSPVTKDRDGKEKFKIKGSTR